MSTKLTGSGPPTEKLCADTSPLVSPRPLLTAPPAPDDRMYQTNSASRHEWWGSGTETRRYQQHRQQAARRRGCTLYVARSVGPSQAASPSECACDWKTVFFAAPMTTTMLAPHHR